MLMSKWVLLVWCLIMGLVCFGFAGVSYSSYIIYHHMRSLISLVICAAGGVFQLVMFFITLLKN